MTRPEPQPPPEHSLRRLSGTRLLGGTTSADREARRHGSAGADRASGQAEPPAPLLPPRARRPAGITAACCAAVVAVLGVFAANTRGNAVDRRVDPWLKHQLVAHLRLVSDVAYIGGGQVGIVLAAVLVVACLLARRVNAAILTLVSVLVSVGLTEIVLKPLVHETINNGWLTYPSGHTASVFTLTAVVGVLMLNPLRHGPRPWLRTLLVAGLVVISCAVAVAVIVLNFHYFTDTIAGAALAVGVVLAVAFLLDASGIRRLLWKTTPSWLKPLA